MKIQAVCLEKDRVVYVQVYDICRYIQGTKEEYSNSPEATKALNEILNAFLTISRAKE